MKQKRKYKIKAIYDTETCNISKFNKGIAYPVLYQLGIVKNDIFNCTIENVKDEIDISLYRYYKDIHNAFINLYNQAQAEEVCYIILVHNLGFDIWSLGYLLKQYLKVTTINVCAKSCQKPITVKIMDKNDETQPVLEFWDTLSFTGKNLETLGKECKMPKLIGSWNYDLLRTPETPLTDREIEYAKEDIYTLAVYMGYWHKINPSIDITQLGVKILTKTGIVRQKRIKTWGNLKSGKNSVYKQWQILNEQNKPKDNNELFTLHTATRGGLTFTANKYAGKAYQLENTNQSIVGFDAASQHPAQIVSHFYPTEFKEATIKKLEDSFNEACVLSLESLLLNWSKAFYTAFYGNFKFTNLRPKKNSVYEKHGIYPLANDRVKNIHFEPNGDNLTCEFTNFLIDKGYKDKGTNVKYAFGKVISADYIELYLTEIDSWILSRCYEWDSVEAIQGYYSEKFIRPSDLTVLSVMGFYKNKNIFKQVMNQYENDEKVETTEDISFIPEYLYKGMQEHSETVKQDVKNFYLSLKGDLNALYGIEITNEYKPNILFDEDEGLIISDIKGIENGPKYHKTFYQFGQRIVGWSRIAQCIHIELGGIYADEIIIGDTDSIKMLIKNEMLPKIEAKFAIYGEYLTRAKHIVCRRVLQKFPTNYSDLPGIGTYEFEFQTKYFSAGWNKAYISYTNNKWKITLAGMPSNHKKLDYDTGEYTDVSICKFAEYLQSQGKSFKEIAGIILGYNVTYDSSITGNKSHSNPNFGDIQEWVQADYLGNTTRFTAPYVVCIADTVKEIGGLQNKENMINYLYAKKNNKYLNNEPIIISYSNNKFQINKLAI